MRIVSDFDGRGAVVAEFVGSQILFSAVVLGCDEHRLGLVDDMIPYIPEWFRDFG